MNQKNAEKNCQIIHFHKKSVFPFCCRAVQACAEQAWCWDNGALAQKRWKVKTETAERLTIRKKSHLRLFFCKKTDMNLFTSNEKMWLSHGHLLYWWSLPAPFSRAMSCLLQSFCDPAKLIWIGIGCFPP